MKYTVELTMCESTNTTDMFLRNTDTNEMRFLHCFSRHIKTIVGLPAIDTKFERCFGVAAMYIDESQALLYIVDSKVEFNFTKEYVIVKLINSDDRVIEERKIFM